MLPGCAFMTERAVCLRPFRGWQCMLHTCCSCEKDRRARPRNPPKAMLFRKSGAIVFRPDRDVTAFDSGSVHTRRVVQTFALGRVSVRLLRIAAVSFILPKLCIIFVILPFSEGQAGETRDLETKQRSYRCQGSTGQTIVLF